MDDLRQKIKGLAQQYLADVQQIRRHIHANPELSFHEEETARYVAQHLDAFGIPYTPGVGGHGVVALLEGRDPASKTIALRADMDALPITEQNDVPYVSKRPGVMHACGHDAHTASLLGAARILHQCRDQFTGTIKFIFQPAEEKTPGGASIMIKDGVLENPRPRGIIGQHVLPFLPAGKVGFREGMYMASADEIYITIHGKGGHGAMPEYNIDPVLISAHIIVALQQVVSRNASPKMPSVLSIGKVIAQGATNVIPNEVYIEGTFRTLDEPWRFAAHEKIRSIVTGLAESMGGRADIHIDVGYPYLQNDIDLTRRCRAAAEDYLGADNVVDLDLWMAAEDFAWYTHVVPGCFYRLGTRNEERGIVHGVHTPRFDIDESALETGAGLMAWLAVNELAH